MSRAARRLWRMTLLSRGVRTPRRARPRRRDGTGTRPTGSAARERLGRRCRPGIAERTRPTARSSCSSSSAAAAAASTPSASTSRPGAGIFGNSKVLFLASCSGVRIHRDRRGRVRLSRTRVWPCGFFRTRPRSRRSRRRGREPLDARRGVEHVAGGTVAARAAVANLLVQHEPELTQPREVAGDGFLVQPQVGGDAPGAGLGDQPALAVEGGVQRDVLEDPPGGQPHGLLHEPAALEHLRERLGAADDAPVGQHPAGLLTERHHVARLPRQRSTRAHGRPPLARRGVVTTRSRRAGTTRPDLWRPTTLAAANVLVSGVIGHRLPRADTAGNGLTTGRSQVQIPPSQLRETPGQPGVFAFLLLSLGADRSHLGVLCRDVVTSVMGGPPSCAVWGRL